MNTINPSAPDNSKPTSVETLIVLDEDGTIRFIHDDDLALLLACGAASIARASHVEPNEQAQWEADLEPVGGPTLGPFPTRRAALQAEVAWLNEHVLGNLHV